MEGQRCHSSPSIFALMAKLGFSPSDRIMNLYMITNSPPDRVVPRSRFHQQLTSPALRARRGLRRRMRDLGSQADRHRKSCCATSSISDQRLHSPIALGHTKRKDCIAIADPSPKHNAGESPRFLIS
jgi:hypothetical protein